MVGHGHPRIPLALAHNLVSFAFSFIRFASFYFLWFMFCFLSLFFIVFVFQLIASFKVRIWKICDYKHNITYQLTARPNFPHMHLHSNTQSFHRAFFYEGGGGGGLLFLGSDINNNDSRQGSCRQKKITILIIQEIVTRSKDGHIALDICHP